MGDEVESKVYPIAQALKMAEEMEADLVEISPNAQPPVCRIIDYSKFLYQLKKRQKEQKAKQVKVNVKEIRFGPQTCLLYTSGLTTVPTHELLAFITDYVAKEPVERILVGLPKQMNNEASENMKRIDPFVRSLQKRLPDMPVEYVDERFTSVLAHRTMLEAGLKKKDRQLSLIHIWYQACGACR